VSLYSLYINNTIYFELLTMITSLRNTALGVFPDGGGGNRDGRLKNTTPGSHLDARGVVVVASGRKRWKTPPLARVCMQGRR